MHESSHQKLADAEAGLIIFFIVLGRHGSVSLLVSSPDIKTNMAAQSNTQHQCLVCRCDVDRGEKYRRRRRIDKCSHDFKVYAMMLGLKTVNFDDLSFACRACFADLEKGVKTVTSLKSIATQTRISAGIDFPDAIILSMWFVLGRHGSVSLCRVERENKMAATYNVLASKR